MSAVTLSCLGSFGRFGNQLFQYAFARYFAAAHGAILQTPVWDGTALFGLTDPPITVDLPKTELDVIPDHADVDLFGYFQGPQHLACLSLSKVRELFTFAPAYALGDRTDDVVAHLRRGDYAALYPHVYAVVTQESYSRAAEARGLSISKWVSEETEQPVNARFPYLHDFGLCATASVLFRANSTFSFWSGVLGNVPSIYSPVVGDKTGYADVYFTEGNAPKTAAGGYDLVIPP